MGPLNHHHIYVVLVLSMCILQKKIKNLKCFLHNENYFYITISVQILNNMEYNQDHFEVLRKIEKRPETTQRKLAQELGFSLGKLNYCLKALKEKGLVKTQNFKKNPNKFNYFYVLTPRGISEKTKLTINFMKRKMEEYD